MRRKIIFSILMILSLMTTVYAEQTLYYNISVKENDVTVKQEKESKSVDSSDVNVKVAQYNGGTETVLYRGKLKDYDDGAWNFTDFNTIQFLVILEWDDIDSEPIYIIPEKNSISKLNEQNVTLMNNDTGRIENNLSFIYNDKYYEKQLFAGNTIKAETIVKNTKEAPETISLIAALYDSVGRLAKTSMKTVTVDNDNAYTVINAEMQIPEEYDGYLKFFIWNGQKLLPYEPPQMVFSEKEDYYGNNFEKVILIDENREVNGRIDSTTDIDVLKFISNTTGSYVVKLKSNYANCSLYDSNKELLYSSLAGKIDANLISGNEYYLKIDGAEPENYSVNIIPTQNRSVLVRDGIVNSSISANGVNNYEFTAAANGTFIFSAVGVTKAKARLFDAEYNLIDESVVQENSAVKVSGDLMMGQKYYISLIADYKLIGTVNYTENTEVPMELMGIE